jgi:hypothetical protein
VEVAVPIAKDAVNYGAQVELGAKSDESFNNLNITWQLTLNSP